MIVHFIRHGETSYKGVTDIVIGEAKECMLTENGIQQAIKLGEKFQSENYFFDSIISSSTPRAIQTANLIFPGRDIIITGSMRAKSSGDWEGKKTIDVYTDEYKNNVYGFVPPNGESYAMVSERAIAWFNDFIQQNQDKKRVAIVTHNFAMKCMITHFLDIPYSHIDDFKIGNVGQLIVEVKNGENVKLIHWN